MGDSGVRRGGRSPMSVSDQAAHGDEGVGEVEEDFDRARSYGRVGGRGASPGRQQPYVPLRARSRGAPSPLSNGAVHRRGPAALSSLRTAGASREPSVSYVSRASCQQAWARSACPVRRRAWPRTVRVLARAQWPLGPCRMGRTAALTRAEVCDQLFDQRGPPGEVPGVAGKLSRTEPSRATTGLVSVPPSGAGGRGPARVLRRRSSLSSREGATPRSRASRRRGRRRRPEPRSAGLRWRTRASGVPTHARAARLPAPSVPPPPPRAARPPSRG